MSRASKFQALWDAEQATLQTNNRVISETREYELITPMFGGGSETQKHDQVTTVRATSVRGHLRFWWRATQAGRFNNLKAMRDHENKLWGAASTDKQKTPSLVDITIFDVSYGKLVAPFKVVQQERNGRLRTQILPKERETGIPAYAAFPLQPTMDEAKKNPDMELPKALRDVSFKMGLTFPPKYKKEIHEALWAWETFGGIGARTRRGFGALHRAGNSSTIQSQDDIWDCVEKYIHPNQSDWSASVPTISYDPEFLLIETMFENVDEAWEYLIGKLKSFRQDRDLKRIQSRGREIELPIGRSKWPEPDAIRLHNRDVLKNRKWHSPGHKPREPHIEKYPRSAFGLPIVFKFKDGDERNGDPKQTMLEGQSTTRMASPLIMRPYKCKDGYAAIVLRLDVPTIPPDGIALDKTPVDSEVTPYEAQQIEPLDGETDVLSAFMTYLRNY